MDQITGATSDYYRGVKKSLKQCSKEASQMARSFNEFVDVEDILKSVHRARNPEEYAARRRVSIVHTPVDWSKYPPSAYRKKSQVRPTIIVHDDDSSDDDVEEQDKDLLSLAKLTVIENFDGYNDFEKHVRRNSKADVKNRSHISSHKRMSPVVNQRISFDPFWTANVPQMANEKSHAHEDDDNDVENDNQNRVRLCNSPGCNRIVAKKNETGSAHTRMSYLTVPKRYSSPVIERTKSLSIDATRRDFTGIYFRSMNDVCQV